MTHIAFVDPLASVEFLVTKLRTAGLRLTAIYTLSNLPNSYLKIRPNLFDEVFYTDSYTDISELANELMKNKIDRIYYGNESSISFTDYLAQLVCPKFANPINSSTWKFDKYEMQEALQRTGLAHLQQLKVTAELTHEQIAKLAATSFPLIIKPVNSAGSSDVELCHSLDEIKKYLFHTQQQENYNPFGKIVHEYVIQEYLQGDEYIIDTFSIDGQHFVSGVLKTVRSVYDSKPICLYSEIVSPLHPEVAACIEYTLRVLTAVEMNNGLAHTELMVTGEGPRLIEVNPRISGANGFINKLFQACGFPAQVDLLIASVKNTPVQNPDKTLFGRRVCLQNYVKRTIGNLNTDLLKQLPSFQEAEMLKQPGTTLANPQNLLDAIAFVLLAHTDPNQVIRDYQQLIAWEQDLVLF
ncbi:ATP-grasp domain-containing protein [soil metagenome]